MVTQQDIAERLGISQETVSRVLHRAHSARVSPERRGEIMRVAHEMGYRPRARTTHAIGYVVAPEELNMEVETRLLLAIENALHRRGFRLVLVPRRLEELSSLRDMLSPKVVDAVIFTRWHQGRVADVLMPEVPWVLSTDEDGIGADLDNIYLDTARMLEKLASYLIRRGHRHLCLVLGGLDIAFYHHMEQGVLTALAGAGIPSAKMKVISESMDDQAGALLLETMRQPDCPTAAIAFSATKSLVLMNHLQAAGCRVPRDISIVSAFDNQLLPRLQPAITASAALEPELAERIVRRLIEKINDPHSPPRQEQLFGEIVERESVGVPRIDA